MSVSVSRRGYPLCQSGLDGGSARGNSGASATHASFTPGKPNAPICLRDVCSLFPIRAPPSERPGKAATHSRSSRLSTRQAAYAHSHRRPERSQSYHCRRHPQHVGQRSRPTHRPSETMDRYRSNRREAPQRETRPRRQRQQITLRGTAT